jgi:hypothetical protein
MVVDAVRRLTGDHAAAVWIDTSENNAPMLSVIKRCGFEGPVAEYQRNDEVA